MATSFDATLSSLGIARQSASATTNAGSTTLGQADFLKLMTAQLNNQDPFDPVDNTQMVAQMAQFSSLAGITEMSTTLKAIAEKLGAAPASEAMGYIGRTVLTEGEVAFARTSGGIAGAIELDGTADVTVTIESGDGTVLKTIPLGTQTAGTIEYNWDGTTDAGEPAGAGPFRVRVDAAADGIAVGARSLVWAPVQSVSTGSAGAMLTLPGIGTVPAAAIRQIG